MVRYERGINRELEVLTLGRNHQPTRDSMPDDIVTTGSDCLRN